MEMEARTRATAEMSDCALVALALTDAKGQVAGGAVTRAEFGRAKIGKPSSDSGRGGGSPRTDGFLSEDAERAEGLDGAGR
jgi:hypothetical protein